jgi:short-subunit dehydrogenase
MINENMNLQNRSNQYTLILGAEGELGKALSREIARKKCNLVLVSTTSMDLQRFAIGLQLKEDVQVDAMKVDLGDPEGVQVFIDRIREKYEFRALINNIACDWSVAHAKCISEIATEDFLTRFRSAAQITMSLLTRMKQYPASYIQNIIPFPFRKEQFTPDLQQSIGKMYAFARELDESLKDSGVSVSMVHPAPMRSIFQPYGISDGLTEDISTLTIRMIAMKAVNGMLEGSRLIIPGFRNKLLYFLNRQAASWFRSSGESLGSALQPSL